MNKRLHPQGTGGCMGCDDDNTDANYVPLGTTSLHKQPLTSGHRATTDSKIA